MLGHLEKLNLLSPNTCFIEFGAGRGEDGTVSWCLDGLSSSQSCRAACNVPRNKWFLCFIKHLGKLSHWVQKAMGDGEAHYVLVDRANCRRKVNNSHSLILRSYILATCSVVPRSQPTLSGFLSLFYTETGNEAKANNGKASLHFTLWLHAEVCYKQ